jgi:hypothetical protein
VNQVNAKISDQTMDILKKSAIQERTSVSAIVSEMVETQKQSVPTIAKKLAEKKQQGGNEFLKTKVHTLEKELADLKRSLGG